jgi:transposase-like protein|tara:strand:+ start:143 stop:748 length:606 start_codon:yes stop_codon:yes gene_type:complete
MADKNEGNTEIVQKALEMNAQGMTNAAIGRHLGVHQNTVRRWFRKLGLPPKKAGFNLPNVNPDKDQLKEKLEVNLSDMTQQAATEARLAASEKEDQILAEIAESQNSPADKYQHYVAAAGIKLLRDSMSMVRGPRTIREMSELDQLIRRNLGLNAKTGGGGGRMQIDISILNNSTDQDGKKRVSDKPIIDVEDTSKDELGG